MGRTKKIFEVFLNTIGFIVLLGMIISYLFIFNPVRFIVYALIIAIIINFKNFFQVDINVKTKAKYFAIKLSVTYILILTILSLSPMLMLKEFRFSHQNWIQIEPKITNAKALWDNGYKRKGNTYADIDYLYEYQGKIHQKTEHEAVKMYYPFWDRRKPENLRKEFSYILSEKINEKTYTAFFDPENQNKSRLLVSTDLLYFRGSLLYDFITSFVFCLMAFLLLIVAAVLLFLRSKEKKN
jgi:hypothetical protein